MAKKKEKLLLAIDRIRVDRGDHHEELVRGDCCDDVPQGTLRTMVRLGQAIPEKEFESLETPPTEDVAHADWKDTPIGEMGLSAGTFKFLNAASLQTAGQIAEFGAKNKGLGSIEGSTEAIEKEIKEAIEKLAK